MTTPDKLTQLLSRKRKLENDLVLTEQQIYDLETSYLEETAGYNISRGWKGFHKVPVPLKKLEGTTLPYTDHIFSLSSITSPLGTSHPWAESLHSNKELAKLLYTSSSSSSSSLNLSSSSTIFGTTNNKTTTISSSTSSSTIKKANTPNKSTPQKSMNTPSKVTPSKNINKALPSTKKKK